MLNFHVPKPARLAPSKMWTSIFCLSKGALWQQLLANQLGRFEYNFRCLKRIFRKVLQKLRSAFFLKFRFLKMQLLVTQLKCLSKFDIERKFHTEREFDIGIELDLGILFNFENEFDLEKEIRCWNRIRCPKGVNFQNWTRY